MIDVIILAAGKGRRSGLDYPKQLMRIAGKPVFIHSLELFKSYSENIILVAIPDEVDLFEKLVSDYGLKNIKVVPGDKDHRQLSVLNGLAHVNSEYVIIHEAVRPFVTDDFIKELISNTGSAIVPVIDIYPTLLDMHGDNIKYLDRASIKIVQLPQKFKTDLLRKCHIAAKNSGNIVFTDDSSMVNYYGYEVRYIEGLEENLKITTPLDARLAEVIYEEFSNRNRR